MADRSDHADSSRIHGGVDPRELAAYGIDPARVLDLSVNVAPAGPHPAVVQAIHAAPLAGYPNRDASRARDAIGRALDCDPARVVVGHGSVELLWAAVSELRKSAPGRRLLIVGPTFGEVEAAASANDVPVCRVDMRAEQHFSVDAGAIAAAIHANAPAAVYLCQPNNPTGRALDGSALHELIARHPNVSFILDQAFLSLSAEHLQAQLRFERFANVIAIRSLTKDHALAGLRVGYALAAPEWLARLERQRPAWMVSAPAEAAIVAAMEHADYVAHTRETLLAGRAELSARVATLGFDVIPSTTHYFVFQVEDADRAREQLLRRHQLLVRSCSSFGLPRHLRVAAGNPAASERLLAALPELR